MCKFILCRRVHNVASHKLDNEHEMRLQKKIYIK